MIADETLQKNVHRAIKWESQLNAAEIGVTAKDGVVTLSGNVDSYPKKLEAEKVTKKVEGVKVLIENIRVKFNVGFQHDDADIAGEILHAFKTYIDIPADKLLVRVEDGYVTLEGAVEYNFEKEAANNAVNNLPGIKSVANHIVVKSEGEEKIEEKAIAEALQRNWSIDNSHIEINVINHKVTLSGSVSSWYEKDEAERIARSAKGVWEVANELAIEKDY